MTIPTREEVVDRIKHEVVELVLECVIPIDVEDFGELHDYIDANELGGFCEDNGITDQLIAHFGGRDKHEGMPDEVINFMGDVQDAVSTWIRDGQLPHAVCFSGKSYDTRKLPAILRREKLYLRALDSIQSGGVTRSTTVDELRGIARAAFQEGRR